MSAVSDSIEAAEKDGLGTFHTLQAMSSSTLRARPPPIYLSTEQEDGTRVPLKPSNLRRRDSKGGLRSIFMRNKAEKIVVSPVEEEPLASGMTEQSMKDIAGRSIHQNTSTTKTSNNPDSTPLTPAKPVSKVSRINLRSNSIKQKKTPVTKPAFKSSPKTTPNPPPRTSAAWDPPPLFQAYPQAIKHAQLSASTLSADAILRISSHKRNNSLRDELAHKRGGDDGKDQTAAAKKTEKANSKHRRQISGSISKADWTQKIFVLVTSGYLLQYSGEGSFDRLPEKMMQLGKDSVAFASDVIPGKHWVLQISQSIDSDGVPAADSRSLLSRLTFRGADYRRAATSLLLVLNSAEDLDSWIAVVRREIEALGGKKHVSETGKTKPDEKIMQLRAQPSHRYLVQRNPDQFLNQSSPMSLRFGSHPWGPDGELQNQLESAASTVLLASSSPRPLADDRSAINSIISQDGRQLDNLRDSANRLSYMSSGQRTLVTSQGSSAASSPTRESMSTLEDYPRKLSTEDVRPRPNAHAINERRRSMQGMQNPLIEPQAVPFRPVSTFGGSTRPPRNYSPPATPNFSVPTSLNKRYSAVKTRVSEAQLASTTAPSKSMLKGTRKAPPAALNVARPLSPVTDSPSPKPAPPDFTPTESSFKSLTKVKASMIDIPPQSPSLSHTSSPVRPNLRSRTSNLKLLNVADTAHSESKLPRRHSSMYALRKATETHIGPPVKHGSLPAAALAVPPTISSFIVDPEHPAPQVEADMDKATLSPLPILASAKPKLRRPTSMQMQSTAQSPTTPNPTFTTKPANSPRLTSPKGASPSIVPGETLNPRAKSPTAKRPSAQSLKIKAEPKLPGSRTSMPMLVNGPPPAPPPNCALPPLPARDAGLRNALRSRNSVRA